MMFVFALIAQTLIYASQPVCETLNSYSYCEIRVEGYPQKIAVISPKSGDITSVKLYFKGYTMSTQSMYDRSVKSLATSLMLYPTHPSERVIIPMSVGECTTYKKSISKLSDFLETLKEWIPEGASLSINAHSGAGAVVSNWITQEEITNLKEVRLFDAIYSDQTVSELEKWKLTHTDSRLAVASVKGWRADQFAYKLEQKLKDAQQVKFYLMMPQHHPKAESPHYSIVRSSWATL